MSKYYECKIKYFDKNHFQLTVYNYKNLFDFSRIDKNNYNEFEQLTFEKEIEKQETENNKTINERVNDIQRSIDNSKNRAKKKIYDYARANTFEYFVTLTFDPTKVDSFDYDVCTKKLKDWLGNIKKRYAPELQYLFVPELHKSGRYHFHGLISNIGEMKLIDSGKKANGNTIYNIGNYKFGFTTATKILEPQKSANYIGKYITKELSGHIKGKKHYWVSRNLKLPIEEKITLKELVDMGINKKFLQNNCNYEKTIKFMVGSEPRSLTIYEFERND